MRKTILPLFLSLISSVLLLFTSLTTYAQCADCNNIGFEQGNLNGWVTTGDAVIVNSGQNDYFGNFPLSGFGTNGLKLGNDINSNRSTAEYAFCVDPIKAALVVKFAIDILDFGHSASDAANINIKVTDLAGNLIHPCATYTAADGSLSGLTQSPNRGTQLGGGQYGVKYLAWTTFNFDLRPFIGQQVKIVATNSWCRYNVDWAYGYVDAECQSFDIVEKYPLCQNGYGTICAPQGYTAYVWTPPSGGVILNGQATACVDVQGPGTYTMTAQSFTGCPVQPITFNLQATNQIAPTANFVVDNCSRNVVFTDSSKIIGAGNTITKWKWKFGEPTSLANDSSILQNPIHKYSGIGTTYNVSLFIEGSNGCRASVIKPVITDTVPNVAFAWANVCKGLPMSFTNNSISTYSPIAKNTWFFKDPKYTGTVNDSAYTSSTTHLYTYAGTYNVVLNVKNVNGCKNSITQKVRIYDVPTVSLKVKDICQYLTNFPTIVPLKLDSAKFEATTTIKTLTDTLVKYEIDWQNDGTIDYSRNTKSIFQIFKQAYLAPGVSNVMVKVSSAYCSGKDTAKITVYPNPTANFIVNNVCNDSAFKLIDKTNINNVVSGITPPPYVDSVFYNYGDNLIIHGFKAPVLNVINHKYVTAGKFPVVEIAKSNYGCINYFRDSVIIYPEPKASFISTNECFNEFTKYLSTATVASAYGSTNTVTGWQWDFNNNGTYDNTTLFNPKLAILGNDTNKLTKLVVTTNHGCSDTVLNKFVIYPLPVANFSVDTVCDKFTSYFIDSSKYTGSENIVKHFWKFEPNATSALVNPSYLFNAPNNYPVKLVVTTVHNCLDSVTKIAIVNPNPVVDFMGDDLIGCEPHVVIFKDLASVGGVPAGSINLYFDYFVDSSKHYLTNYFTHTFIAPGFHSVGLKITTNKGCSDSLYKKNYIEVYPKPKAAFVLVPNETNIADPIITIVDKSKLSDKIDWDFGDNTYLVGQNYAPTIYHSYTDTGSFIVVQYVTTNLGCKDTVNHPMRVNPEALVYIPNAFSPNADGVNDIFNAKFFGLIKYELRIFDRWGKVVGLINDASALGWDGNDVQTGQPCKTEVYTWKMNYTTVLNEKRSNVGSVTLLR
jgi:gliding motility-associated-like protein